LNERNEVGKICRNAIHKYNMLKFLRINQSIFQTTCIKSDDLTSNLKEILVAK